MALDDLYAELDAKRHEVLVQVKAEFIDLKLSEYSSWGRKEMYAIKKAYVEKDVSATTNDKIDIVRAPTIHLEQKIDTTKKQTHA